MFASEIADAGSAGTTGVAAGVPCSACSCQLRVPPAKSASFNWPTMRTRRGFVGSGEIPRLTIASL
jgi:hypothetical protein